MDCLYVGDAASLFEMQESDRLLQFDQNLSLQNEVLLNENRF